MESLSRFRSWVPAVAVAVSATVSAYIKELVAKSNGTIISWLVVGAVILIIAKFSETYVDWVLEHTPWLRRRLLGRNDIEGTWIEVVREGDETSFVTVVKIVLREGSFSVLGRTYDSTGAMQMGFYDSIATKLDGRCLYNLYRETDMQKHVEPVLGSGQMRFDDINGSIERYHSSFFDPIHKSRRNIGVGYKVKAEDISLLDDPDDRRRLFPRFIKEWTANDRRSLDSAITR